MKIISKEIVWEIPWNGDQLEYDKKLSQLCPDGQYFIVVNPELDYDVLDLINIEVPLNDYCVKFKVGEGWIAKRFSPLWNGKYQIISCAINPKRAIIKNYVDAGINYFKPKLDAWDLKYQITWTYDKALTNGADIDAVIFEYVDNPVGRKVQGQAPVNSNFDVIFLSYNEPAAQENWLRLLDKGIKTKHVNGVKGILNAHKAAAEVARTDMFYVVDADAYIVDDFKFDYCPSIFEREFIHVWQSENPVNGLKYGYGGVKLFPRKLLLEATTNPLDVSTSLGKLKVLDQTACITKFNTDPFNTWKSAFRESVKLSARVISNQNDLETEYRLKIWQTTGLEKEYGKYALEGARLGAEFGYRNQNSPEELIKINNYEWLHDLFKKHYE